MLQCLFTEQYISTVRTPASRGSYTADKGIVKHLRLLTLNMLYHLTFYRARAISY